MLPEPPAAREHRSVRTNAPHQRCLGYVGCCIGEWLLGRLLGSVLLDLLSWTEGRRISCWAHIGRHVELPHRLATEEIAAL